MEWLPGGVVGGLRRRRSRWARFRPLGGPESLDRRIVLAPLLGGDGPILPAALPNDPAFAEQWGLRNTGQHGGTPALDINAVAAWDVTTGSSSVVVAVIDSGADLSHPDLVGNLWRNPGEIPGNGIDDDANGFVDDVHGWDFIDNDAVPQDGYGHGTHVAGIIGAVGNDQRGVTGVAWDVSLMILRVQDDRGAGSTGAVLAALQYATKMRRDHGIFVVATNNSWDAPSGFSGVMESLIRAQGEAGIMFVAAAGNQASDVDVAPRYPGGYDLPNVINVAAAAPGGDLARLSNVGATGVDLAAPGTLVVSTWLGGTTGMLSGTSMAAPHVSGAIALLAAARPALTVGEIRTALLDSTRPIASHAGRTATGGMLDVRAALAAIGAAPRLGPIVVGGLPGVGTSVVGGIGAAPPAATGLPVSDSFDRPVSTLQGEGWRRLRGRFVVKTGAAMSRAAGESLVMRDDVTAADVDISTSFSLGRARSVGVVGRSSADGTTLYRARVVRTRLGARVDVHRRLDGRWTLVATGPAQRQGTLRFQLVGSEQIASIDGVTVARASDTAISRSGFVGLLAVGSGARVTDFHAA